MEKTPKPIIENVHAREILDSRGLPTVEVEIVASGHKSISAVPSGASTGEFEALELRDGDSKRFNGKGVLKAVDNVINSFGPALVGKDASNQKEIDDLLLILMVLQTRVRLEQTQAWEYQWLALSLVLLSITNHYITI